MRKLEEDIRWVLHAQAERIETPPDLAERIIARLGAEPDVRSDVDPPTLGPVIDLRDEARRRRPRALDVASAVSVAAALLAGLVVGRMTVEERAAPSFGALGAQAPSCPGPGPGEPLDGVTYAPGRTVPPVTRQGLDPGRRWTLRLDTDRGPIGIELGTHAPTGAEAVAYLARSCFYDGAVLVAHASGAVAVSTVEADPGFLVSDPPANRTRLEASTVVLERPSGGAPGTSAGRLVILTEAWRGPDAVAVLGRVTEGMEHVAGGVVIRGVAVIDAAPRPTPSPRPALDADVEPSKRAPSPVRTEAEEAPAVRYEVNPGEGVSVKGPVYGENHGGITTGSPRSPESTSGAEGTG
jgi:hypothetical protein